MNMQRQQKISVKILNSANPSGSVIQTDAAYTSDGNYVASVIDANRNSTAYTYEENNGTMLTMREPGETFTTRTQYQYDSMNRLTQVGKIVSNIGVGATYVHADYTYDGDRLKTIFHTNNADEGTTYTFSYGPFDRGIYAMQYIAYLDIQSPLFCRCWHLYQRCQGR